MFYASILLMPSFYIKNFAAINTFVLSSLLPHYRHWCCFLKSQWTLIFNLQPTAFEGPQYENRKISLSIYFKIPFDISN